MDRAATADWGERIADLGDATDDVIEDFDADERREAPRPVRKAATRV